MISKRKSLGGVSAKALRNIDLPGFCLSPFVLSFLPAGNKDMMAGPPEVISGAGNKDLRMVRNSQRSLVIWRSRSTSSELPKIPCYVTGKTKPWSSLSHCHWVFDYTKLNSTTNTQKEYIHLWFWKPYSRILHFLCTILQDNCFSDWIQQMNLGRTIIYVIMLTIFIFIIIKYN